MRILNIEGGFMALSTILLLSAVMLVIVVTVSLTSIGEMQASFGLYKGEGELHLVEGCVEDVLIKVNSSVSYTGGIIVHPEGTCTVIINPGGGGPVNWNITVSSLSNTKYQRKIQVTFTRNPPRITMTGWKEI